MKNKLLILAFVVATLSIAGSLIASGHTFALPSSVLSALRWVAIALFAADATVRRSLTAWIFVGLFAGAELGYDAPAFAAKLQFLGNIFLRLIKVIIAPLLFGILVTGIAGHANLKKVGRLGWKSLVYFEVVSTIALLIGLAAINISKAGESVHVPHASGETLNVTPHSATQIIT